MRQLDVSHWLHRGRAGSFDATSVGFVPNYMPGPELEARFGSASADLGYGANWGRTRDPAIDSLTESIKRARNADELFAATRALDRVLMWNFYLLPRTVDARAAPDVLGPFRRGAQRRTPPRCRTWTPGGGDERKAARVSAGIAALEE